MIIPSTVVDNFFNYPDKIKDYGLSLPFTKSIDNIWPGQRTQCLSLINKTLYNNINLKVTSLFFNYNEKPVSYKANLYFQKVSSIYEEGWVHQDPNDITFIIYLTPNAHANEGTSIFYLNDVGYDTRRYQAQKEESFANTDLISQHRHLRKEHNSHYAEVMKVSNLYNRLFAFDSYAHHAANSFICKDDDTRLTLIGFISDISRNDTPIRRINSIGI